MIISAACTSGMGEFSPCVFYRKNQRVLGQKGSLVDDVCRRKRRDFLRSLRDSREELQDTKKESRKHTRRIARNFLKQQTAFF
jgi:prephenate dehydrogenase